MGRERSDPQAPLVADYLERISKIVPIEDVVLKADRSDRIATRMLAEKGKGQLLVALDEHGDELTSSELAALVASWMERSVARIAFAVGGAEGLPGSVLSGADRVMALSRMTLPHRLARLLLAEQLYRALAIIRSIPYQK